MAAMGAGNDCSLRLHVPIGQCSSSLIGDSWLGCVSAAAICLKGGQAPVPGAVVTWCGQHVLKQLQVMGSGLLSCQ